VTVAPCVLVVDDDPSIRALYRAIFSDEGYRVETAVNGQDALDQLGCAPDLIVLDLAMPFMDGTEFLRQFGLGTHASTPVLVVSAHHGGKTPKGASAVMSKPFDTDTLLGQVSGMLALAI
jgi:CheY-like chemotaxis protein